MLTNQIFRSTGSLHPGPRSDYCGWNEGSPTGPTKSNRGGIQFGHHTVQIRDWRIKQIDDTHLSVSHEAGNVARVYRADGTVQGNVSGYGGYTTELGVPTCSYLTDKFLQIGDWRIGAYDATHLSVAHRLGMTSMVYRTTGTLHYGPRTDFSTWIYPAGEVIKGSNEGCVV